MDIRAIPVIAIVSCAFAIPGLVRAEDSGGDATASSNEREDFLGKATEEYRHRRFADAANDLGAALPSEFNNPLLHYYYANCMVHLKHKESAIREYRIAYALQPSGTIGDYCKLCLDRFGIDAEGKKAREPTPVPKSDAKKSAPDIPEPPNAAEVAALKANPKDGSIAHIEREKSVENLRDLMQQRKRVNGAPLPSQVGTNLYVRNYKETPGAKENSAVKDPSLSKGTPAMSVGQIAPAVAIVKTVKPEKKFRLWWW